MYDTWRVYNILDIYEPHFMANVIMFPWLI